MLLQWLSWDRKRHRLFGERSGTGWRGLRPAAETCNIRRVGPAVQLVARGRRRRCPDPRSFAGRADTDRQRPPPGRMLSPCATSHPLDRPWLVDTSVGRLSLPQRCRSDGPGARKPRAGARMSGRARRQGAAAAVCAIELVLGCHRPSSTRKVGRRVSIGASGGRMSASGRASQGLARAWPILGLGLAACSGKSASGVGTDGRGGGAGTSSGLVPSRRVRRVDDDLHVRRPVAASRDPGPFAGPSRADCREARRASRPRRAVRVESVQPVLSAPATTPSASARPDSGARRLGVHPNYAPADVGEPRERSGTAS